MGRAGIAARPSHAQWSGDQNHTLPLDQFESSIRFRDLNRSHLCHFSILHCRARALISAWAEARQNDGAILGPSAERGEPA